MRGLQRCSAVKRVLAVFPEDPGSFSSPYRLTKSHVWLQQVQCLIWPPCVQGAHVTHKHTCETPVHIKYKIYKFIERVDKRKDGGGKGKDETIWASGDWNYRRKEMQSHALNSPSSEGLRQSWLVDWGWVLKTKTCEGRRAGGVGSLESEGSLTGWLQSWLPGAYHPPKKSFVRTGHRCLPYFRAFFYGSGHRCCGWPFRHVVLNASFNTGWLFPVVGLELVSVFPWRRWLQPGVYLTGYGVVLIQGSYL